MNEKKLYFVCGCPRSATSAFSHALAEHKELSTSAESNFLYYFLRDSKSPLYDSFQRTKENVSDGWFNKHKIEEKTYLKYIGGGIIDMFIDNSPTNIYLEQSPENILVVDKLIDMFPNTKIINMVRDGREVVCSMLKSGFKTPWSNDFQKACEAWNHYAKKGYEFSQKSPEYVLNVYQKELVNNTENSVRDVYKFLELEYEHSTTLYLSTKRVNSSYGNENGQDFKTAKDPALLKVPQWEKWTKKEMNIFYKIAGDTMKLYKID